jgi:hypothetical protein
VKNHRLFAMIIKYKSKPSTGLLKFLIGSSMSKIIERQWFLLVEFGECYSFVYGFTLTRKTALDGTNLPLSTRAFVRTTYCTFALGIATPDIGTSCQFGICPFAGRTANS